MRHSFIFAMMLFAVSAFAGTKKYEFHLWPNGAPNNNEVTEAEVVNPQFVVNITDPQIHHLPTAQHGRMTSLYGLTN